MVAPASNGVGPSADELRELRRPFTPEAIRFKAQITGESSGKTWAITVAYIDARLVIERLNAVVAGRWAERYEQADGLTWCVLSVNGQTHRDVGDGKGKALVSDALKRAAVRFGVGVSVYAAPKTLLKQADGHLKVTGQKKTVTITEAGEQVCRENYERWLAEKGEVFGEPLDHGDVAESQGDVDAVVRDVPAEADPVPADAFGEKHKVDPETQALVKRAREAYAKLAERGTDVLPAALEQTLRARLSDREAMQAFVDELEGRLV